MKQLKFILFGSFFGFVLIKSEAVSWYRIVEMFHFQSFHMFGVIGSAVAVGAISVLIIKQLNTTTFKNKPINLDKKPLMVTSNLLGGIIFGLGWSIVGACPAPLFIHFGAGNYIILIPIIFALIGTFVYGSIKDKLPH
ncbi:MAG: YeeE/YedE family protein [Vicingus serpentipes]|nr:YeeE/YedE family protein [Vicingus serpentipes]